MKLKTIDMEATGRRIHARREKLNLRVAEVAEAMGLGSLMSVYNWEYGKSLPTLDNLILLADVLKCRPMDLIVIKEERDE